MKIEIEEALAMFDEATGRNDGPADYHEMDPAREAFIRLLDEHRKDGITKGVTFRDANLCKLWVTHSYDEDNHAGWTCSPIDLDSVMWFFTKEEIIRGML